MYIYIHDHICIYTYIYIYIYIYTSFARGTVSKAPQGKGRGAMGSKSPPCMSEPWFFSARHDSKIPGFVLRPLFPYAIASLGVA